MGQWQQFSVHDKTYLRLNPTKYIQRDDADHITMRAI